MSQTYPRLQPHSVPATSIFIAKLLALVLTIAIAFFLSPASASASSLVPSGGPTLQVNAGFGAYFRNGSWVPLYITLRNNGPDFSGTLATSNPESPVWQDTFSTVPVSTYQ